MSIRVGVRAMRAPFFLISLLFATAWFSLPLISYPRYLDDILYLSTAWEHLAYPHILNRYVTIYLLEGVNYLSGHKNPILAGQFLGAFIFLVITLLTFINARLLCRRNSNLAGSLAVVGLLSCRGFIVEYGEILADYTATALILFGVMVFLRAATLPPKKGLERWWVIFGAIAYAAIRTKETGVILGILVIPLLLRCAENPKSPGHLSGFFALGLGAILMAGLFGFLNWLMFGQPLFGFRSEDLAALLSFNTRQNPILQRVGNDYWSFISSTPLFMPALLVLWGDQRLVRQASWLWGMVIALVLFLDFSLINGGWHLIPRYFTPGLALLSVLAGVTFSSLPGLSGQPAWKVLGVFPLAAVLGHMAFLTLGKSKGMGADFFFSGLLIPALGPLLVLIFPLAKKKVSLASISLIIYLLMVLPSALSNSGLVISGKTRTEGLFKAFSVFSEVLSCENSVKVFSSGIPKMQDLPIGGGGVIWEAYDLFFACHTSRESFIVGDFSVVRNTIHNMGGIRYVFVTREELDQLVSDKNSQAILKDAFDQIVDQESKIALLIRKS